MSKKVRLVWMATLLLILSNFFLLKPMLTMRNEQPKATWLWHTSQIAEKPEEILEFLDKQKVSVLFLQVNEDLPDESYQAFIRKANEQKIKVHALDGAPHWTANQQSVQNFFRWVEKYQSVSDQTEQFSGVHLDIEPYILPDWNSSQQEIIKAYQRTIRYAADESAILDLHFGIDIPFWFDKQFYSNTFGEGVLSEWLIDQTDSVTIMAYRNQAKGRNGIVSLAQSEVDYANSVNKEVRIAVETSSSSEGDYLSFYGKDDLYLNKQLKESERAFNYSDAFQGMAIHSLESWMKR